MLQATCYTLLLVFAGGIDPPVANPGWKLALELKGPKRPLLVGECLGDVEITLTLTNTSCAARTCLPFKAATQAGLLDISATQHDRLMPRQMGFPFMSASRIPRSKVEAGKAMSATLPLAYFNYHRVMRTGKVVIKASIQTEEGEVVAAPMEVEVIDVAERDVKAVRPMVVA